MEEQHDFEEIDYSLAHNIIWSAVDYAEEFGFKPHKDFTNTTQFFLEEDTDDIALIEIECGKDGKPFYIQGDDNNLKANQVIAQLELTTGKGNYRFAIEYTPSDGNPTNENFLD
jgi:hypothetical protein